MPFNFPDPAVSTTATNPVTGASYQWKADPGKWVLTGGPLPGPDPEQERQDNEIDNIEQLQRELHSIVSDSVYFYPGFGLEGQLPNPGQYLPFEYTFRIDSLTGDEIPTYFKSPAEEYDLITHMRIAAVAGVNAHIELAEVGDIMYIQHIGTDAGGKYLITEVVAFSGGPDGYFEIKVDFIEGFSDGNIEHPGYDQIQIVKNLDEYVKKTGDVMTGGLVMNDANILVDNGQLGFVRTGDAAELSDVENRFSTIKSVSPINSDTKTPDYSKQFGIQVEIDDGNTFKNKFKVNNRNGDIVSVSGGTGPSVQFGTNFPGNTTGWDDPKYEGSVTIKGIPTPAFDNPEPTIAVNKEYVDNRDERLRQDIIELEEEIDAIAPSVEYGTWEWRNPTNDNPTRPPDSGTFFLIDANNPLAAVVTDKYAKTTRIVIHNEEYLPAGSLDPVNSHTWADADVGKLIQLFDAADPDFLLGEITAKDIQSGFVYLDVQLIQTSGQPNDNTDTESGKYLTRVNIFEPPSGGDVSGFVLKSGDTMEGPSPLVFKTKETSFDYNKPPTNGPYLKFENDKNGSINSVNLWLGANISTLTTDQSFMARGGIYTKEYYYAYGTSGTNYPRIRLQSSTGSLQSGTTVALAWDSTGVNKILLKGSEGANGYVLRLDSSKKPYWSSPPMPTYTITSSNGNYYVQ